MSFIQEMNNLNCKRKLKLFKTYLIGYEIFYLLCKGNQMLICRARFPDVHKITDLR